MFGRDDRILRTRRRTPGKRCVSGCLFVLRFPLFAVHRGAKSHFGDGKRSACRLCKTLYIRRRHGKYTHLAEKGERCTASPLSCSAVNDLKPIFFVEILDIFNHNSHVSLLLFCVELLLRYLWATTTCNTAAGRAGHSS